MNSATSLTPTGGAQRAASLMLALGEEQAAQILQVMDKQTVEALGSALADMKTPGLEESGGLLQDFLSQYESAHLAVAPGDYTRRVMIKAFGEDNAVDVLSKIDMGADTRALESLRHIDPHLVAAMMGDEHPQIQAIIISYLPPERAAAVLQEFPDEHAVDLMGRLASLEAIDPAALSELNHSLAQQVLGVTSKQNTSNQGVRAAANIINKLPKDSGERLLSSLSDADAQIGSLIQEQLYVFDDLLHIVDREFQVLLREVATDRLAMAMKGAEEAICNKIYTNMSKRAADMLRDDIEDLGPVRVKDVEEAQQEILDVVKRMTDAGDISPANNDAEMVG